MIAQVSDTFSGKKKKNCVASFATDLTIVKIVLNCRTYHYIIRNVKEKKGFFSFLQRGKRSEHCKQKIRCNICSKRHCVMMCLCLEEWQKNTAMGKATEEEQDVSLPTQFCLQLILQTILLSLEVNWKKRTMVAIIDTGCWQSYILKKTVLEMGCQACSLRGWYTPYLEGVYARGWNVLVMNSQ